MGSRTPDHFGEGGCVEVPGGVGLVDLRVLVHLYLLCCCLFLLCLLRLGCHALLGFLAMPLRLQRADVAGLHVQQLNCKRAAIVPKLIREEHYLLIGTFAEHAVADSRNTPLFDNGLGRLMEHAEALQLELDCFVLDLLDEGAVASRI